MGYCFGENLKYLREEYNIEQAEIAKKSGLKSASGVSEWEKGIRLPKIGVISDIAKMFNVSIDDLMYKDLSIKDAESNRDFKIPLIGTIAAGTPILAEENIEHYFLIDPSIKADFCLRIKGDSMIDANINNGDIAFIRKQPNLETGEIGAVLIEENATLKRFYQNNGIISLQAANPKYAPILLSDGDVRVLGKLVGIYSDRS